MQENPFEKLDSSHEHIPPSSENTEQPPHTKHIMQHTQQRFVKTICSADSDEMVEYEKGLLQNSLNKKMLREDEKDQYRNVLLQNMDKLIDVGLLFNEDDGKYYFHNLQSHTKWPKIGRKNLTSFPDAEFLRKYGIIDQDARSMTDKNQIEKLFEVFFGAEKIATEEDYKKLFTSQLKGIVPELKKIGLELRDGKYYLHNLAGTRQWPKIEGKRLVNFPNTEFLREHGIIDQDARSMTDKNQIEKLFEVFFGAEKIATEEDYKKLFTSQLEGIIPELEKIGLELSEGKYYFGDLQGFPNWPNIEGKHLRSFPNAEFLIKYKIIGQNNAFMTNRSQLAKLFTVLGFEVWYEPPKSRKK